MDTAKKRYHALDALRGLSLLLMIMHHFFIDLIMYGIASEKIVDNPLFWIFQPIFASCFVALSGASGQFSRSNLRRGLKILAAALGVSAATYAAQILLSANVFVTFGILHFLGVSAVLYHLARPLLDKAQVPGFVWLVLFIAAYRLLPREVETGWLFPLGLMGPDFHSADYYPLLPWIFMYLFGAWAAVPIRENRLPARFYSFRSPFLEWVSRHSLWIFLLHQPVLIGLFELYFRIIK